VAFATQQLKTTGGGNNTVVDGSGQGVIQSEADETVILLAEGDDFVETNSNWNKIESQAGNNYIKSTGENNAIYVNNGDNTVLSSGNKNYVQTNNGNNTIVSVGDENKVSMNNGNNNIASVGNFNNISSDGGDNIINSFGNNNKISTNNGNNTIASGGDYNTVKTDNGNNYILIGGKQEDGEGGYSVTGDGNHNTVQAGRGNDVISSTGNYNILNGGAGNDNIISIGHHNNMNGQDGDDMVLSLGDYNTVGGGDGNNVIVFDGNHLKVTAGDGDNFISTLDFAIKEMPNSGYDAYASYLDDQTTITSETIKGDTTYNYSEVSRDVAYSSVTTDILNKLADIDKSLASSIDFSAKAADGSPKYVVAQGKSDGLYHIYEYSSKTTYKALAGFNNGKRDYSKVSSGNGYLYLNNNTTSSGLSETTTTATTTVKTEKTASTSYTDNEKVTITGIKDVTIDVGNGNSHMMLNVSKDLNINKGNGNNVIDVTGEIVSTISTSRVETSKEILTDVSTKKTTSSNNGNQFITGNYSTGSPLIVDFNKDGKISAIAGQGVDIDNNGYSDGAATGGDKMLAMSDMNGNSVIDGGEVFGDQTISPFTGEKLNAANGFEALKMIAEQAQAHTGINCISNGEVNLEQLKAALGTVGVSLGFISDNNITELEDFGHVVSINVNEYTEQDESGEVQHRQIGSYTDKEGAKYETDDVWFKLFGKN